MDVVVKLDPNGTLDVFYDGTQIVSDVYVGIIGTAGRFGFGARTGGSTDNHFVDNLRITTQTESAPYVNSFAPLGAGARPDAPISILLADYNGTIDTNAIQLTLDGAAVTPAITSDGFGGTLVRYQPAAFFTSGSSHTVQISFADLSTPTPRTNSLAYGFTVDTYGVLSPSLAVSPSFVNLSSPGFNIRYSQIADMGSRDITRAELQLANLLTDGSTGQPYENLSAPNPTDSSYTYQEPGVLNYSYGASSGNFPNDAPLPGLPGPTTFNGDGYAMRAITYLHLLPGFYKLGVNSSDGFKLTSADSADIFAPQQAIFSSVRSAADTTVSFSVSQEGYYPFRLVHFSGDQTYNPAPGTPTPSVEFFNTEADGTKVLINDTSVVGYVPAFMPAKTRPYVRSVSPGVNETGVAGNTAITATLVDGSLTVQPGTIQMTLNGAPVTPAVTSNAGVHRASYQPSIAFAPDSTNLVSLAFTDSDSNRRTNTWSFVVANVMTPIWSIPAVNNTWVTAGSTERGLAYNHKTGHLLLVSRAAAPAPANGLGIAILDSNNGNVIGTMNVGDIASTGVGTFRLSMIDVAEDGVIYACNLTTSAGVPFQIYRWENEAAAPQLVYSANPIGGAARCGDSFRVRGSGSGTQIIANGNSAVNTSPIFSTVDGINFTGTAVTINGATNIIRLGLAFGCGNTFYGETTGQPVSYIGFTSPTSSAASLLAQYGVFDKNTNQSIGPIGVDLNNQRLIGNQTVAPHNINLYDLPSLAPIPAKNFPIDQRDYASQNTSFGTGSVDFTPDGSRVFCLDTGNGIIAFSLAPRLATPAICAQPRTNFYAAGTLAYLSVGSTGHLPQYQWKFNGAPLSGATNRTLDIPNFQLANAGLYSVTISNSSGSITSSNALLDIPMNPVAAPATQVVAVGGTANFSVTENGGKPGYTYQWRLNGANIASATSSTLTVTNAQQANAGSYTVAVTDSVGQTVISSVAALTVGTLGTGTGLTGDYFSGQDKTFTTPPTLSRLDATVDFDWDVNSPDGSISADTFTVRWTGQVQPLYTQTYTFYTTTDDGVRLWVDGKLLINKFVGQAATEWSGTIALVAGQKYNILMEYFEGTGNASARLRWSSANQVKGIIPATQLYPGVSGGTSTVSPKLSGSNLVINWSGTYYLQSAPSVEGPYTDIAGPLISPYTNSVSSGTQQFFRLRTN